MPFCSKCGRRLADNEECNCQSQPNPTPQQNVHFNFVNDKGKPVYDELGRPIFTQNGEPITYDEYGNPHVKKKKTGCIIAIIVCLIIFLLIVGILALILVPAMIGYTNKSKLNAANANAKTIITSANSTLTEMDEKGYTVLGTCLISSDKSDNINCENIDTAYFYDAMEEYAGAAFDNDWFIIIEDGIAKYSAVETDDYVGTYPARYRSTENIPMYNDDYVANDSEYEDVLFANSQNLKEENN